MNVIDQLLQYIGEDAHLKALTLLWTVVGATAGGIFLLLKFLVKRFQNSKSGLEFADRTPQKISLSLDEYERRLKERVSEVLLQYKSVDGQRKKMFKDQLDQLQLKLNNLEPAYTEAIKRIAELEINLQNSQHDRHDELISKGVRALRTANFKEAAIDFDKVLDDLRPQLSQASGAAFGLGIIAEENVDWVSAAKYFQLSCTYLPNEDNLLKSSIYLWRAGFFEDAAATSIELQKLFAKKYGKESLEFAGVLNNLGAQLYEMGNARDAILAFEKAIIIRKKLGDENSLDFVGCLANLGNVYVFEGNIKKALLLHRKAVRLGKKAGIANDSRYSTLLNGLTETLRLNKNFSESEIYFRRAGKVDEMSVGQQHPFYARDLHFLSKLLIDLKKYKEAAENLDKALKILYISLGKSHTHTLHVLQLLIFSLKKVKDRKWASEQMRALESYVKLSDSESPTLDGRAKYFWEMQDGIIQRHAITRSSQK